jgi:hypothetical protein
MERIKGFFNDMFVNIGDKHLTMSNPEDICSLRIFIVDDVLEIGPNENAYECTVFKVNYKGKITSLQAN